MSFPVFSTLLISLFLSFTTLSAEVTDQDLADMSKVFTTEINAPENTCLNSINPKLRYVKRVIKRSLFKRDRYYECSFQLNLQDESGDQEGSVLLSVGEDFHSVDWPKFLTYYERSLIAPGSFGVMALHFLVNQSYRQKTRLYQRIICSEKQLQIMDEYSQANRLCPRSNLGSTRNLIQERIDGYKNKLAEIEAAENACRYDGFGHNPCED